MELGWRDAERRHDEIVRFFTDLGTEWHDVRTSESA
jgi:hypothetical protein